MAAPLALVAISGCGGGSSSENGVASKSADQIIAEAKSAADSATSVHVSGSQTSGSTALSLDLSLQAGKGGSGQISEKGASFELVVLGGTAYIKGSPSFYRSLGGAAAAQLFKGKWLKAPSTSGELSVISSLTDMRKLIDTTLVGHGALAKGSITTIAGQKAIGINDKSKGGTLYVAATGKPYPIELSKTGSEGGTITFDRWNQPVTITAPSGAIDLSQLEAASKH
ncbi:MAG TPA: hypothetical protein VID48_16640 [Solirubrobacteraceae bacterium]